MPANRTRARGRVDFARQVAATNEEAQRAGLLTAPLLEAADAAAQPGVAELLRGLAEQGNEHRLVLREELEEGRNL